MRYGIDAGDVAEALLDVTPLRRRNGRFTDSAVAHDDDIKATAQKIRRFLEEMPGEVSVAELCEALDEAIADRGDAQ